MFHVKQGPGFARSSRAGLVAGRADQGEGSGCAVEV